MEFTNEFRVSSDIETTFATLVDLERIAPCLPGAVLDDVDGNTYTGRMKVRVGPIQVSYSGVVEVTEIDPEAHRATIRASGTEERGSGTASADVVGTLREEAGQTVVTVLTNLNVTGKPTQFGRGVLGEVGARVIRQFAEGLEELMHAEAGATEPDGQSAVVPDDAQRAERGPSVRRITAENDSLNLVSVAGAAVLKRLVPLLLGLAILVAVIWWLVA